MIGTRQNGERRNMAGVVLRGLLFAAGLLALPILSPPAFANGDGPAPGYGAVVTNAQSTVRMVKLGLNKSVIVDLPRDARDVLVSNPEVANAVIRTNRRIYLTGVKVGQTNIVIFDRAGTQIVSIELEVERDSRTLAAMLKRLIPNSAIDVEVVSDNIVLSGSVRNAGDARRAQDIANIFANGGANAQPTDTSTSGPGGGTSISITSEETTAKSSVVNLLSIEGEDQVHLKVTVAEVNRNTIKQLGIEWDAEFHIDDIVFGALTEAVFPINQTLPGNSAGFGWDDGNSSIFGTIQALEEAGVLRTLAEPTLTAISGEQASFLAGGEFPVPVAGETDGTGQTITVEFKPFGVSLAFVPVVLSEGRISLRVKTEVSELSNEGAVTISDLTIPALKVRRAETTMELPSGGSMVMGGLLRDDIRQAINGVPGLKNLPVLGALFRSRDFLRQETELVIIATPYLVKPVGRPALARPDDGFSASTDSNALLLGHLNSIYGGPGNAPTGNYQGHYGYIYE
jgi:pilus assembly protein CpaC